MLLNKQLVLVIADPRTCHVTEDEVHICDDDKQQEVPEELVHIIDDEKHKDVTEGPVQISDDEKMAEKMAEPVNSECHNYTHDSPHGFSDDQVYAQTSPERSQKSQVKFVANTVK